MDTNEEYKINRLIIGLVGRRLHCRDKKKNRTLSHIGHERKREEHSTRHHAVETKQRTQDSQGQL